MSLSLAGGTLATLKQAEASQVLALLAFSIFCFGNSVIPTSRSLGQYSERQETCALVTQITLAQVCQPPDMRVKSTG